MGEEAPKIRKRNDNRRSTSTQEVLLVNYTPGIEIGILVTIIYEHTAVSFG